MPQPRYLSSADWNNEAQVHGGAGPDRSSLVTVVDDTQVSLTDTVAEKQAGNEEIYHLEEAVPAEISSGEVEEAEERLPVRHDL